MVYDVPALKEQQLHVVQVGAALRHNVVNVLTDVREWAVRGQILEHAEEGLGC